MCGIAGGVWRADGDPVDRETLVRMAAALRNRGPDDAGTYLSAPLHSPHAGCLVGAGLGFRRLSIIDVSGGRQPMSNEDGSVWIVFNGEIYNYRSLRRRLEGSRHTFRTDSDTETLIHLYEDEGLDFLKLIEGMFAFALWDERRRRLILARDRLGKQPLVYRQEAHRLLFASELKSLLEVDGVPRDIDPAALDAYLTYQYVPHPLTIFRGIRKLPPAHYAVYQDAKLTVAPYWTLDASREVRRTAAEYRQVLREQLTAAVEKRLQSEVPLGAFLSGGVDSSIVVGLMRQLLREPVKTFSIGFPVAEYDETSYARQVAERFGTAHHEFRVRPEGLDILPKLAWHYDEPFADSSAIPTYYLAKLTREHVTVSLSGDGGDELFAGYLRYRAVGMAAMVDRWPRPVAGLLGLLRRLPASGRARSLPRRLKRWADMLGRSPNRRYLEWMSIFGEAERAALYRDEFMATLDHDPGEFLFEALDRARGRDAMTAASLADLVTYLPCDLMTKVDIAAMANSLETRKPFLDHHVVELAAAMPIDLKYRAGRGKRILLETFADLLPKSIQRRGKMGFGVPLARWFREEWADTARDMLLDAKSLGRGYFRHDAVRRLLDEHAAGLADHGYRLWSLVFLEAWSRQWLDAPHRPPLQRA